MDHILHYFQSIFTDVFWPYIKPYIDQMIDPNTWTPSYVMSLFGGSAAGGKWGFIILGIILVVFTLRACDYDFLSSADEAGFKEIFLGDSDTHRGFIQLIAMASIINLMFAVYRPIQQLCNSGIFHTTTNAVENNMEGMFNPFAILLMTVVIMHGFMDSGRRAFCFAVSTILFPAVITVVGHTPEQWILLILEMIAGGTTAAVFSKKRYVYNGYIAFSIFYLVSQLFWSIDFIESQTGYTQVIDWKKDILMVFMSMRTDILLTAIVLTFTIVFERVVVSSARDANEALYGGSSEI